MQLQKFIRKLLFALELLRFAAFVAAVTVVAADTANAISTVPKNSTETVGFVQETKERDTVSLILSCVLTLGLCVYSALHLNVPPKYETYAGAILRQTKWCLIALLAPEVVLYAAWKQWASARSLCRAQRMRNDDVEALNDTNGVRKLSNVGSTNHAEPQSPFTMREGFYATMGGFAIDIEESFPEHAHLFPGVKRLTLTASGYDLLHRLHLAPQVSPADIEDKNKTDVMAKIIVIVQVGWMLVQTVGRKAAGLPITLLEVHTVAHVVCALAMYGMWWDKLRQVGSPTRVDGSRMQLPLIVFLFMASGVSQGAQKRLFYRILHPWDVQKGELGHVDLVKNSKAVSEKFSRNGIALPKQKRYFVEQSLWATSTKQKTNSRDGTDDLRARRQQLALEAIETYPLLQDLFEPKNERRTVRNRSPYKNQIYVLRTMGDLVQPHVPNFELRSTGLLSLSLPRTASFPITSILWLSSMIYGSIHIAAWTYFFPSTVESLLWRVSSVWVTACSSMCLFLHLLGVSDWDTVVMFQAIFMLIGWANRVLDAVVKFMILVYVLARSFLVAEAFVSLRRVPWGVYDEVQWMEMIPHL